MNARFRGEAGIAEGEVAADGRTFTGSKPVGHRRHRRDIEALAPRWGLWSPGRPPRRRPLVASMGTIC